MLINHKALTNLTEMTNELFQALYDNKLEDVKRVIATGCPINNLSVGWDPTTPLIFTAERGRYEMMECLLIAGADPNGRNPRNDTALMMASLSKELECVKLLLKWNADPNLHDISRRSALTDAAQSRSNEIVELLLAAGAEINHQDNFGNSALLAASLLGNGKMIEVLVKAGASPHLPDRGGKTAIHWLKICHGDKPHLLSMVVNYPKYQAFCAVDYRLPRDLHTFIYPFVIS